MAPLATTTAASLLLLLALAATAGAATTSPAPAPAVDCTSSVIALSDCLDFVTPGDNSTRPSKTCCGEVKTAVRDPATVGCLCGLMGSKSLPIPINMTRVFALPTACGQSASVFSKCHVVMGGAPTQAPSPSAGGSSSGGAAAASPKPASAARFPVTATLLVATVAAPLLSFYL